MTNVSMDLGGGTDLVGLTAAEALHDAGFDVALRTLEPTNWETVARMFPGVTRLPETSALTRKPPAANGRLRSLRRVRGYRRLLRDVWRERRDSLVVNLNGDLVPSPAHLTYVHYPAAAASRHPEAGPFAGLRFGNLAAWMIRSENRRALRRVRPRILANSTVTQASLREALAQPSEILFPPVRLFLRPPSLERTESVVTVASFRPRKRIERVLEVAALLPGTKWHVVGSSGPAGSRILQDLERKALARGVQDRVSFQQDAPRETVERLYWTSRIYFHPTPQEHFGISVVEAMRAGCVPVVPRSGGQWVDILGSTDGRWGFGYDTPEEAAEVIRTILADRTRWSDASREAQTRSNLFSEERFSRDFVRILQEVAAHDGS